MFFGKLQVFHVELGNLHKILKWNLFLIHECKQFKFCKPWRQFNCLAIVGLLFFICYDISTLLGYLMPTPFYTNNQFDFKQFSLV